MRTLSMAVILCLVLASLAPARSLLGQMADEAGAGNAPVPALAYSREMKELFDRYVEAAAANTPEHPGLRARLDAMDREGKLIWRSAQEATDVYITNFGAKEMDRSLSSIALKRAIVIQAQAKREIERRAKEPDAGMPITSAYLGTLERAGTRWDNRNGATRSAQGTEERDTAAVQIYWFQYQAALSRGERIFASAAELEREIASLEAELAKPATPSRPRALKHVEVQLRRAERAAGARAD